MNTEKKSGRGCLFWFGIAAAVLLLFMLLAVYGTYRYVKWVINEYTDTKPLPAPALQLSHAEVTNLQQRVRLFDDAIKHNQPTEPLTLTTEEINALIAEKAGSNRGPARLFFSFNSNQVQAQLSVPTDGWLWHWLDGRYLNGSGNFDVSLHDGNLSLKVKSLEVKGRPLPENFMQPLRQNNFADGWTNDPDFTEVVKKLQEIKIENGKVTVIPKPREAEPAPKLEKNDAGK
jgi:hypothetical protein